MTEAQWLVMDNANNRFPLHTNMSMTASAGAMTWAIREGLIDMGRLTQKGEAWWAVHRHEKPEGVR